MHVDFEAQDPDYEARVRANFARQALMQTLGARLEQVAPGRAEIAMSFSEDFAQQPGVLHAGICTALLNSATVLAGSTLTAATSTALAVEFKVDLLEPAQGVRFRARAEVVRVGRTLTRCRGSLEALGGGRTRVVAQMVTTLVNVGP